MIIELMHMFLFLFIFVGFSVVNEICLLLSSKYAD